MTLILSAIFFPLIKYYVETKYWSTLAKKKNIWNKFISKNKYINKAFDSYQKAEKDTLISLLNVILIPLLLFIYFIFQILIYFLLLNYVEKQFFSSQSLELITYFLSIILFFIFALPLMFFSSLTEKIQRDLTINNHRKSLSKIKILLFIIYMTAVFYLFFIAIVIVNTEENAFYFGLFTLIPLFFVVFAYSSRKSTTMRIKNILNNKYSSLYPCIKISTVGGEIHTGKLNNIFDDESIRIINHKRNEVIILWDAVATITELKEIEEEQKQLTYFDEI
ncbi:hypothetical protein [Methanolobus sp. WCC5]|uniref:hypothetical protein n=1 Tax=Methanolobus sp. WCC5 TaxID=3125785 RepID=UPI0032456432